MKLIHCHIENFGSLHQVDIDFNRGLHVICENNGWGKSTLAAFLRAMFYGLAGDNKRQVEDNERKYYAPWQGGVFGGSIIFETEGRRYLLIREFGDSSRKKKGDTFELRDAITNRPSSDYTISIGEELFGVNRESFLNTVFLSQNSCITSATDGIHARIGKITDNTGDMDCYQKAQDRITAELNRLTPDRKTGSISKRADQIHNLQVQIENDRTLDDSLNLALSHLQYREQEAGQISEKLQELANLQQKVTDSQAAIARREKWMDLRADVSNATRLMTTTGERFPNRVPTTAQIHEQISLCRQLGEFRERYRNFCMTDSQAEDLERYRVQFSERIPGDEEIDNYLKKEKKLRSVRLEAAGQHQVRSSSPLTPMMILGLAAAFLGLILAVALPALRIPGIILSVLGFLLMIAGYWLAYSARTRESTPIAHTSYEADRLSDDIRSFLLRYHMCEYEEVYDDSLHQLRDNLHDFRNLSRRQESFADAAGKCRDVRDRIVVFLEEIGFAPETNLAEQLQQILEMADDYEDAVRDYNTACQRLADFQSRFDVNILSSTDSLDDLPTQDQLNQRRQELEQQAEESGKALRDAKETCQQLRDALDAREANKEALAKELEQQEEELTRYRCLKYAADGLAASKSALAARYSNPVYESFCRYYSILTGDDADCFHLDTDIRITREVYGTQRPAATLSCGQQDLVGFCLRVALVDAMYQNEVPMLILDDPFINLDDAKVKQAMILLEELEKRYQIIYFTCSQARS